MRRHKCSWTFLDAVSKEDVPDYYDIIKDPIGNSFKLLSAIDIKSIEKKLYNNQYNNKESFINDLKRMFSNAKIYN